MLSRESFKDDFIKAKITDIINCYRCAQEIYCYGTVIKILSNSVVAKVGPGVTEAEYINQLRAYQLLNEGKLRVPEPYRFFKGQEDDEDQMESGFLLMEFLPGNTFDPTNEDDVVLASETIKLIHQRSKVADHVRPGPVSGVCATGFPWLYYEAEIPFKTVEDLEKCLNERSTGRLWQFRNGSKGWVLCHLDYTSRNFIRLSDGSGVGVLDWPTSAFYPAYFDLAALKFQSRAARNQDEKRFLEKVTSKLGSSMRNEFEHTNSDMPLSDVHDQHATGTIRGISRFGSVLPRESAQVRSVTDSEERRTSAHGPDWKTAVDALLELREI